MTSFSITLKTITVLVLIGLFCWNSAIIFKHFLDGKMVTSSEDISNQKLRLPGLFICREVAFTDDMKDMSNLQDYFDNTLNLKYELWYGYDSSGTGEWAELINHGAQNDTNLDPNDEDFKVEYVYSYSRGLCYTFQFLTKVRLQYILLLIKTVIFYNN
jgi:hypothetical protein